MKYLIEEATLTGIADAIREKQGLSDLITVKNMAQAIIDLPTGSGEYINAEGVKW